LNILHISSASSWRGGERQVNYLIEGLQKNGNSNYLMTPKNSVLTERCGLDSTCLLNYKKGIISLFQNIKALKRYCYNNKIDLIHGHDSHAHTLLWMAYRFGGLQIKSVVTRRLINPIKTRSYKKYNYPKIEKIICISNAVKKVIEPSIADNSRLTVIHSSIKTSRKAIQHKNEVQSKDFVIGYVAAFTEEKDHNTFLSTAKHLLQEYPEISFRFLLIGDGPLLKNIQRASEIIQKHIKFTGFVEDVDSAYLEMNLLLHTSKSEALGTSILDAMKFGLPIISTKVGGIPEIVKEDKNGYLFNIGDYQSMGNQIYKIATDKGLYDFLASNNEQILSNFDTSLMVQKTQNLYSEILK